MPSQEFERSVRFAETNCTSFQRALHLEDYTDEEVDACWYSQKEFRSMKRDVFDTIQLLQSNTISFGVSEGDDDDDDDEELCTRGLEHRLPRSHRGGAPTCAMNRKIAKSAVFLLQQKNRTNFPTGATTSMKIKELRVQHALEISKVYQIQSKNAKLSACLVGAMDAHEAQQILEESSHNAVVPAKEAKPIESPHKEAVPTANVVTRALLSPRRSPLACQSSRRSNFTPRRNKNQIELSSRRLLRVPYTA